MGSAAAEETMLSIIYTYKVHTVSHWTGLLSCVVFSSSWYLKKFLEDHSTSSSFHIFLNPFQFSHSVMSNSLWLRGLQHTRPPCLSPTPRVYSNSCPLSRWCHPTFSSSVITFSPCLQSFPASGSFQMSQFFASGGQSIEVSALVVPMNIQE